MNYWKRKYRLPYLVSPHVLNYRHNLFPSVGNKGRDN